MLKDNITKLRGSDCQRPNWDSYGAAAISDDTLDAADCVAMALDGRVINGVQITRAVPTPAGAVSLCSSDETVCIEVWYDRMRGT